MKDWIQIKKLSNGFLVNYRDDSVADRESYVFETLENLLNFIVKNFQEKKVTCKQAGIEKEK